MRNDSVAQPVEHNTFNVRVLGSNPSGITENRLHSYEWSLFLFSPFEYIDFCILSKNKRFAMLYRIVLIILLNTISLVSFAQEKPYLGAEVRTMETFQYGKFEVRMKPSEVSGIIYSFFTFYDEPDFASHWNEIDVEILGRYNNEVQFNAIVGSHQMFEKRYVLPFNPHDDFHNYAFIWTPKYIAWSVDGIEVYRQTGDHVAKMNRPQKLMMNIWPSSSVGWAGKIDDKRFPLQAEYDLVRYYTYEPSKKDTFILKWTDNFDTFDLSRWQTASHTFDTNECVFTPDNVVVENGFLNLKLTKPVDDEVEYVPTQFIQTVEAVVNFSKKYTDYLAVRVDFYIPINKSYCKVEFFSLSNGEVKHMYFDIDRKYVILYVEALSIIQIKTEKHYLFYKPTGEGSEKYHQVVRIK
jgi:hypothetical protein